MKAIGAHCRNAFSLSIVETFGQPLGHLEQFGFEHWQHDVVDIDVAVAVARQKFGDLLLSSNVPVPGKVGRHGQRNIVFDCAPAARTKLLAVGLTTERSANSIRTYKNRRPAS